MLVPYAVTCGDITDDHIRIYNRVQTVLRSLSSEKMWSCHEVCQVVEESIPELIHCRGWFAKKGVEHSWMRFADQPWVVIDPYPVAGASGPLLVSTGGLMNPWNHLYILQTPVRAQEVGAR